MTLQEQHTAKLIARHDRLLAAPSVDWLSAKELTESLLELIGWLKITRVLTHEEARETVLACFPQYCTRWHA